ncbi:MAG: phage portal protein [Pseudomonadota bacterium]
MSLIDRIFRRQSAPTPAQHRRSFDAATGGRRASQFRAFGSTATETLAAGPTLRSRARHAYGNSAWVRNAVDAIVAEIVGAGITATSAHPDTDQRQALDAHFAARSVELDAEGRTDLAGLTAAMVRAEIVDGEAFALIEDGPEGVRLRLIPAEQIDESKTADLADGGYIAGGIEFTAEGTRRAYHIFPRRPTDVFSTASQPVRIRADNVLHLFRPLGPGQARGVSQLAPVLLTLADLDGLLDALLTGAKIAACHAGWIRNLNDLGAGGTFDAEPEDDVSLEPGVVRRLGPGEEITFNSPAEAKDSVAFARLTLQQIAAGLGVPEHLCHGDLSNANYSSLRAGLLPFRAKCEQFSRHTLAPQFLNPVWRRVITAEYVARRIDLPDLEPALRVTWIPPEHRQVDPAKSVDATAKLLELGLMSRREAAAKRGLDVADLDAEIAADRERETDLGLTFSNGESTDAE